MHALLTQARRLSWPAYCGPYNKRGVMVLMVGSARLCNSFAMNESMQAEPSVGLQAKQQLVRERRQQQWQRIEDAAQRSTELSRRHA